MTEWKLPIFAVRLTHEREATVYVQAEDHAEAEAAAWELVDWDEWEMVASDTGITQLDGLPRGPARYWVDSGEGHWVDVDPAQIDGSGAGDE